MNNLTLSERYRATQALATFQRLNLLDDLWTQYLEQAREIPRDDIQVLKSTTEGMTRLLERSSREAEWLRSLVAEREQDFDESLSSALEQYPLTNEARNEIRGRLGERGGFASIAQAGTETIMRDASEAKDEIAEKMRRIEDGDFVPGDLPPSLKCALLAAGAAAAIAAHQYPIAISIALHMSSIGCF